MSLPNPYAQYRQNSVETATPTRLVVMLYDGAIRFLSQAQAAMQAKNHVQQSVLIGKAQAILAYLRETLDAEVGKAFAESLDRILAALMLTLTEANIRNKPEPVAEAIAVLRDLRESWAEVDRQCQAGKTSSTRELIAA